VPKIIKKNCLAVDKVIVKISRLTLLAHPVSLYTQKSTTIMRADIDRGCIYTVYYLIDTMLRL